MGGWRVRGAKVTEQSSACRGETNSRVKTEVGEEEGGGRGIERKEEEERRTEGKSRMEGECQRKDLEEVMEKSYRWGQRSVFTLNSRKSY